MKLTIQSGIGSRRVTGSNKRNNIDGNLDSDTDDGSHMDAPEDRIVEDGSEDSDVTIEDWQNELRTWEVGVPHSNTKRTSAGFHTITNDGRSCNISMTYFLFSINSQKRSTELNQTYPSSCL